MHHDKQKNDVLAPGGKQEGDADVMGQGKQEPGADVMPDEGTTEAEADGSTM